MKFLVTAGNTQTPIDRVRCITNIFTGRTGAQIATEAARRGHDVTVFTSHPETIDDSANLQIATYRTFDELHALMAGAIPGNDFDAVIHVAAVSDFFLDGIYALAPGAAFDADNLTWSTGGPHLLDVSAGKVKSSLPELWLRLKPTEKLIDLIREPWGFRGKLVKFKLEVGLDREDLLRVAEKSRLQSKADLMVANTLESRGEEAWIGAGEYERVTREQLAGRLVERLEG
jgi:phosphopantothenate-cysteine ligase/phosphopantothenoylcysteine decarboxylase/phosphopantothenate--cysteine ligase